MKYFSTNQEVDTVDLRTAVLQGLPKDKGLFMPEDLPLMPPRFFEQMHTLSFKELASAVALTLLGEDLPADVIVKIVDDTLSFNTPLVKLDDKNYILELFHGPTLAFKDVGARFMARLMSYYLKDTKEKTHVLVATSGDTGSAVAYGFYEIENIDVILLYPSGKISKIQEQQLTTLGKNITALEIEGSFDDCQDLVKQAFVDEELNSKMMLSSANSINLARLIPQTFYYFNAVAQLRSRGINQAPIISVPSGNLGNLTAGLIAKRIGLPVKAFIAACNKNDSLPKYLQSEEYHAQKTKHTISNAMDVGNPSNIVRIQDLYGHAVPFMKNDLHSWSFYDEETKSQIKDTYTKYNYILDPHGAVGMCGAEKYHKMINQDDICITVETAHPAKFGDIVEPVLGLEPPMPERLERVLHLEKKAIKMAVDHQKFKEYLLAK
jgi:threonine synthase